MAKAFPTHPDMASGLPIFASACVHCMAIAQRSCCARTRRAACARTSPFLSTPMQTTRRADRPRIVIAEDESMLREQLKTRLMEAWPDAIVVGEAQNGGEAL